MTTFESLALIFFSSIFNKILITFDIVDLKFFLSTIISKRPCFKTLSAVWKLSGKDSVEPMVLWITRRPAKPIVLLGSPMAISDMPAHEADTQPVVGLQNTTIYGSLSFFNSFIAMTVLGICIKAIDDSIIL